jgi:hypothetical protein
MNVLIGCEFSGMVRDAFRAAGHDAWSCDLLPTETGSRYHLQKDIFDAIGGGRYWDLMVAFPPCTYLCRAGDRWYRGTPQRAEAARFFARLLDAPVPRIAVENPRSHALPKPDVVIQPWEYGHRETKATCLWLRRLPVLMPTDIWAGPYEARVHRAAPGPDRWRERSRTLPGIAAAMAAQWGSLQ